MFHLYKLSAIIATTLLVGCGTLGTAPVAPDAEILKSVPTRSIVLETQALLPHAEMAMSAMPSEPIVERVEVTGSRLSSESVKSFIPTTKKAVKVIKAVKDALADETAPTAPPSTAPTATPTAPGPTPRPAQTGAKLQVLGIDLEFWVGNDDNWSTVWKLIVLVLFVYGGLRFINLIVTYLGSITLRTQS